MHGNQCVLIIKVKKKIEIVITTMFGHWINIRVFFRTCRIFFYHTVLADIFLLSLIYYL